MSPTFQTQTLYIRGMSCASCSEKIQKTVQSMRGVQAVNADYAAGTAVVTYDADTVTLEEITRAIEKLDYQVSRVDTSVPLAHRVTRGVGVLIIIIALFVILQYFGVLNLLVPSQIANSSMGYGMLFVVGLVTSIHCVAMCGGINLSQCIPRETRGASDSVGVGVARKTNCDANSEVSTKDHLATFKPSLLYNLGRVTSYTAIGFVVGGFGSVISFSPTLQGALKLIAGVFMIIMGINMLGFFPFLRKINPRMPKAFTRWVGQGATRSSSPFIVGLLNGFMPCGPLQAMQIYALSTGSPFAGALAMFLFSAGTVPLMFGLGALSSLIGKKFTRAAMAVGSVLLVVLGLSMFTQGLGLSGVTVPPVLAGAGASSKVGASGHETGQAEGENGVTVTVQDGVQVVESTLESGAYPHITVSVGMPVKWIIDAPEGSINGCNNRILIPEYNMEHSFTTGENIIEFDPTTTGTFQYSCWMGMIYGSIKVVDEQGYAPPAEASESNSELPSGCACCTQAQ